MKRFLSSCALLLSLGIASRAQVIILNDNVMISRMSEIRTEVRDSLTGEPIAFASVYVIPSKDTTITNFTLTDSKGEAKLDEVPYGKYVFHVEMMGYKPFAKERYFREQRADMGTIRLQPDEQFLQAAVVSEVANPIVIKKDTVEFNASSFRVGTNAMLKDLLQRMPGMEITESGTVRFNGEVIDKLTVGGRTFFFNDQSTALNNLPASIVDKIRVIDRESEQARASGVRDGSREKVLDVGLKKEYEEGWFGNAGFKGGTTWAGKAADEPLRDNRGLLYNGNLLASAYGRKDQITLIGNGQNINDSNAIVVIMDGAGMDMGGLGGGLSSGAQLGLNANTSRIKDVETTAGANYRYSDTDSGNRSARTTYQDGGDLFTVSEQAGKQFSNAFNTNLELQKEKGDVWFHLRPGFRLGKTASHSTSTFETTRNGALANRSESASLQSELNRGSSLSGDVTIRNLWKRKGRSFRVGLQGTYETASGNSEEQSLLSFSSGGDGRSMLYESSRASYGWGGDVRFTEPLGEKWTVSASGALNYSHGNRVRDAFDTVGPNEYYSSIQRSDNTRQDYGFTVQYRFAPQNWISLGTRLSGSRNETYSKTYGVEETTGVGEWNWFVTPTFRFGYTEGDDVFNVSLSGRSQQPSSARMLPVLNIANLSQLSLGNIYLKPYGYSYFTGSWSRNNRERFSTLMMSLYGEINTRSIITAQWFDAGGIRYTIPVNARKPSAAASVSISYMTPLDERKQWSLSLSGSAGYSSSVAYQARSSLPALDKDAFVYADFMSDFWGNDDGDRFYNGESGFAESITRVVAPTATISVRFNPERGSFSAGVSTSGRVARYTLDPRVNMNTLDTRLFARASYMTRHEFEFHSDLTYVFYKGYSAGYGQPEWQWNGGISKNVGAFNLSVTFHDLLNQTRNLTHVITDNYEEESYHLALGRYVLFGVKWNFGKMNASHTRRAQQAAWNMVL